MVGRLSAKFRSGDQGCGCVPMCGHTLRLRPSEAALLKKLFLVGSLGMVGGFGRSACTVDCPVKFLLKFFQVAYSARGPRAHSLCDVRGAVVVPQLEKIAVL